MKLLLLDDHPLVRCAMESVILSLGKDIRLHSAGGAAQARKLLAEDGPFDLALVDLQLADGHGFEVLASWRQAHPGMPVVILSASERPEDMVRALDEGAMGFIPKRMPLDVLSHALRMVMSGGVYVPPMALRPGPASTACGVMGAVAQPGSAQAAPAPASNRVADGVPAWLSGIRPVAPAPPAPAVATPGLRLTPRQSEVLELLMQGQPNKLIARRLNLSVETVKDHVASLLRVLGVSSRTQAVLVAARMLGAGPLPPGLAIGPPARDPR